MSNYQLFGTAGGVQVGSYELNANRRAVCDTYLDWVTYNSLHGKATTMPSIFVSNAGTGRCVPDVVGLGFTMAVQNGTAAGLIGGTSLAAPQTAAVWALRGHQEGLHYRDLMYWLYAGRGGNLPKTDAYGGSIGTGFDQARTLTLTLPLTLARSSSALTANPNFNPNPNSSPNPKPKPNPNSDRGGSPPGATPLTTLCTGWAGRTTAT